MTGADIRAALDELDAYARERKETLTVVSASSLWVALGIGRVSWQQVTEALQTVAHSRLGADIDAGWLRRHADDVAELLDAAIR